MKRVAMIVVLTASVFAMPAKADHYGRDLSSWHVYVSSGYACPGYSAGYGYGGGDCQSRGYEHKNKARKHKKAHKHKKARERKNAYARRPGYHVEFAYRQEHGYPSGHRYGQGRYDDRHGCCDPDVGYRYRVHPIHETFVARCTSNVRAGPGTRYPVIDQVHSWGRVWVIGKVSGRDWYEVRVGHRSGFVYAPLLRPLHYGHGDYGYGAARQGGLTF